MRFRSVLVAVTAGVLALVALPGTASAGSGLGAASDCGWGSPWHDVEVASAPIVDGSDQEVGTLGLVWSIDTQCIRAEATVDPVLIDGYQDLEVVLDAQGTVLSCTTTGTDCVTGEVYVQGRRSSGTANVTTASGVLTATVEVWI